MCLKWLGYSSVLHGDAQLHFKMFKPIGLKHVIGKCCGGIWVGIISEIWNHRNRFLERERRPSGGFLLDTKEDLVLDHDKGKCGQFFLLRLVFGTSMLYEVFERLIFSVSCVVLSRFGRYCVFVQVVLVTSFWQGRTEVAVLDCSKGSVFDVCLSVWC